MGISSLNTLYENSHTWPEVPGKLSGGMVGIRKADGTGTPLVMRITRMISAGWGVQ